MSRLYCLLVACAATAHGYHLAAATPRPLLARTNVRAAKMLDMPVPKVAKAYTVLGSATVASWTACALVALSTHPNAAINAACGLRHNVLTIAQALALPLPLAWCVFTSLTAAANVGFNRLASATYRRLNIALAVASFWMAAATFNMPLFAYGYDMYHPLLKFTAGMVHTLTGILCTGVWVRTVKPTSSGHYVPRLIRGFIGSIASLVPEPSDVRRRSRAATAARRPLYSPSSPGLRSCLSSHPSSRDRTRHPRQAHVTPRPDGPSRRDRHVRPQGCGGARPLWRVDLSDAA